MRDPRLTSSKTGSTTLSAKDVEYALPGASKRKLWDKDGLYLQITPIGTKSWYFKFRFAGVEKKLKLGSYPELSLKDARAKRDEMRAAISKGDDPSRIRRLAKLAAKLESANTFGAIALELIEKRVLDGIADATESKARWLLSLLEPSLGRMPVVDVTAPVLLVVLQEIQKSGRRETARRLRSFASRVIDYAVITGRAQYNPASALQRALITPQVRSHPAIVDEAAVSELLRAIETYDGYPSTIGALQISPHLFQRPGEIRMMRWSDVKRDKAEWKIPKEIMKMRREHKVPLSRQSLAIIDSMEPISSGSEYVFPAFHSMRIPISENTVNQALVRLGYAGIQTAHGFRSTASTLLNESGLWNPDVIEHALAHKDPDAVRSIYNRAIYWQQRVEMMQWWSDRLDELRAPLA